MGPKTNNWCLSKRGENTHTEDRDVTVDIDFGVLQIEAKEHQGLQETQEAGRGMEESFLNHQWECGLADTLT